LQRGFQHFVSSSTFYFFMHGARNAAGNIFLQLDVREGALAAVNETAKHGETRRMKIMQPSVD
jgi:hypothetical protein